MTDQECFALADIRRVTGLGNKPMLSEIASEIEALIARKDAEIAKCRRRISDLVREKSTA